MLPGEISQRRMRALPVVIVGPARNSNPGVRIRPLKLEQKPFCIGCRERCQPILFSSDQVSMASQVNSHETPAWRAD